MKIAVQWQTGLVLLFQDSNCVLPCCGVWCWVRMTWWVRVRRAGIEQSEPVPWVWVTAEPQPTPPSSSDKLSTWNMGSCGLCTQKYWIRLTWFHTKSPMPSLCQLLAPKKWGESRDRVYFVLNLLFHGPSKQKRGKIVERGIECIRVKRSRVQLKQNQLRILD